MSGKRKERQHTKKMTTTKKWNERNTPTQYDNNSSSSSMLLLHSLRSHVDIIVHFECLLSLYPINIVRFQIFTSIWGQDGKQTKISEKSYVESHCLCMFYARYSLTIANHSFHSKRFIQSEFLSFSAISRRCRCCYLFSSSFSIFPFWCTSLKMFFSSIA